MYRLDLPDEGKPILRSLHLPGFKRACFFAPDDPDFRWIGASNRMVPWIAGDDLQDIYDRADDQNPAFPPPNRRGLFLLLETQDGGCLALLALAGPKVALFSKFSPTAGLVVYDWREGTGSMLPDGGQAYSIKGFDYRLFTLAPVRQGWAVIGRADKYLAPAAVEAWEATPEVLTVTLHESGPTVIYSERGPVQCSNVSFRSIGGGLWRADLPVLSSPVTLKIHRGS